jgi:hypothetical protein
VIGKLGRRAIDLLVVLFALLGFAFVPLGKHTALEHVVAIFSTSPARDAGHELVEATDRLKRQLLGGLRSDTVPSAEPPSNAAPARRRRQGAARRDAGPPDASLTWAP